jgi:D-alanyl-D-alanine carboxypeptidase/D-alanyl-D-alanine-endopeptidase (penicillin-binding protein 4)
LYAIRRCVFAAFAAASLALVLAARVGSAQGLPVFRPVIPAEIRAIMAEPKYRDARWGLYVADRASGEVLYDLRGGERFIAASTTKLWPGGAALDVYGPDFRFETPVYRRGKIDAGYDG